MSFLPRTLFRMARRCKTKSAKKKAEIDEAAIEAYRGTMSLPVARGKHGRVAGKIVDDRGIESLKILDLL